MTAHPPTTPPPATHRGDVVDTLHGERVPDPYRWLEDDHSAETAAWVEAQNAVTHSYLSELPGREDIAAALTGMLDTIRHGAPQRHGDRWFSMRHDGLADQPVLVVADDPRDEGRILINPKDFSADGTVALNSWSASDDGRRVVYATSEAGSDWMTWRIRDVDSGKDLDDVLRWSKFSETSWLPDSSGFFYGALDAPAPDEAMTATNEALRLQLHILGSDQADDRVVYVDPDPKQFPEGEVSADGRWLVVTTSRGTALNTVVKVAELGDDSLAMRPLVPEPIAMTRVIGNDGATFYAITDLETSRRRLVAIDLDSPEPEHWRDVIGESEDQLLTAKQVGGRLVCEHLHDASSSVQVYELDGTVVATVPLDEFVTVTELTGRRDGPLLHLETTSFTDPASVWQYDVATGRIERLFAATDSDDLVVTERAHATSPDGTSVPMFLVHRRDVTPNGDLPTMLYAYGGFDIPITPTFSAPQAVWVQRGGLLAVANLRGGGEFGAEWYEAGRREHKQNVFDDMAACARWLASSGWTRPARIVINGGSNGGLLVGAVLTQHPDLIGAAVPEVGVLDMLRFHRFTIGWAWTDDLGDPDSADEYPWVRAYSPLHQLRPGTAYPPTLVMTGDHDDRVVPAHSFKFAAALQLAQGGDAPALIRIETSAGHGMGKPVSKVIDERTDMLAFCEAAVGPMVGEDTPAVSAG
jgi:prolyl oligopeptidase